MTERGLPLDAVIQQFSSDHDEVLLLSAGEHTEELARFITEGLSDDELDQVDVWRDIERRDDLAAEPLTVALLIGVGGTVAVTVGRIIERWLENRRQRQQVELAITAYGVSNEAGKEVVGLLRAHARVSLKYE